MSSISRIIMFAVAAVSVPFVLTTLFVAAIHGEGLRNATLHWTIVAAITCSGLPFILLMPVGRTLRLVLSVISVPVLFVTTVTWGAWIACTRFGSCP